MDIKANKDLRLSRRVLGTENPRLKGWIIGPTLGFWMAGFLLAIAVNSITNNSLFYDEVMLYVGISSLAVLVLSLIALVFSSDWDHEDGKAVWNRVILYNLTVFFSMVIIFNNVDGHQVTEPVERMVFKTSYKVDCPHTIHLHTKNIHQTLCDNGEKTKRFQTEKLKMNIVAGYRYGELISGDLEIIENEIILADNE